MLQLKNINNLKFRGQLLDSLVLFLNLVQQGDGKTYIIELYPYLSQEAKKEDWRHNHLRHEIYLKKEKDSVVQEEKTFQKGDQIPANSISLQNTIIDSEGLDIPLLAQQQIFVKDDYIYTATESSKFLVSQTKKVADWEILKDLTIETFGHIENPVNYQDATQKIIQYLIEQGIVAKSNIKEI